MVESHVDKHKFHVFAAQAVHQCPWACAWVSLENRFKYVNDAWCEMTGYTTGELLNSTWMSHTINEDVDADLEAVHRLVRGEIDSYSMTKRYRMKLEGVVLVRIHVFRFPIQANEEQEGFVVFAERLDRSNPMEMAVLVEKVKELEHRYLELELASEMGKSSLKSAADSIAQLTQDNIQQKTVVGILKEVFTVPKVNTSVNTGQQSGGDSIGRDYDRHGDSSEKLMLAIVALLGVIATGLIAYFVYALNNNPHIRPPQHPQQKEVQRE